MRRLVVGLAVIVVLVAAIVAGRAVINELSEPDLGPTSLPAADPCAGEPLQCVMTDDPGIRGVVLPRKNLQFAGLHKPLTKRLDIWSVNTRYGRADDYVAFYRTFMPANGWRAVPDETRRVADGSGSTTDFLVWQRAGGVRVATIVGTVVDADHGPYVSITINNQYGMNCINSDCTWPDGTRADMTQHITEDGD